MTKILHSLNEFANIIISMYGTTNLSLEFSTEHSLPMTVQYWSENIIIFSFTIQLLNI